MKTLNKIFKNSTIIRLSLAMFGLGYSTSTNEKIEKTSRETPLKFAKHLEKLTNYDPLEKQEIDSAFSFLNYGLRENLKKVYFIKKEDLLCENACAEAHGVEGMNIICLTDSSKETIFHESAHIRQKSLDKLDLDFSKKWTKIANFEYGVDEDVNLLFSNKGVLLAGTWKDDSTKCPKNGLLNSYSAKFMYEDIATFVESLGYVDKKEWAKGTDFPERYPLFFANTTDHRYQKKLDLLKEYEFLTKEEHEKLSKNLGSLNYLLKSDENKK